MPRSYTIYGLPQHIEDLDPYGEIPRLPIGERETILSALARLNTAPEVPGGSTLYGPGIEIDLPEGDGMLESAFLRVSDESISTPVMIKISGEMGWCLWDPEEQRNVFTLPRRYDDLS